MKPAMPSRTPITTSAITNPSAGVTALAPVLTEAATPSPSAATERATEADPITARR